MWGDDSNDVSRRQLLRTTGAAVGAGALGGLAGCTDQIPMIGGGLSPDPSGFEQLTYEPGEIDDVDNYDVNYLNVAALIEEERDMPDEVVDPMESRHEDLLEMTGLNFDNIADSFSFRTTTVLWVDHDQEEVAEELDDNRYTDEDPQAGYQVYRHRDDTSVVGFDGSRVIEARPTSAEDDPVDVFDTVIDTINEEEDRYADDNDAFVPLLESLSTGEAFVGTTHESTDETDAESGQFENEVARGVSATFRNEDDDTAEVGISLVFKDPASINSNAIENWTETDAFEDYSDIEISLDENVVTVSGTVDYENFSLAPPNAQSEVYDYVPRPTALTSNAHMQVDVSYPMAVREEASASTDVRTVDNVARSLEAVAGIDPESLEAAGSFHDVTVGIGEVDPSTVRSYITGRGFEETESYEGYDVYESRREAVALSDEAVIVSEESYRSQVGVREALENAIDTAAGSAEGYVDASEDFQLLVEATGDAHYAQVMTQDRVQETSLYNGQFEGQVGRGYNVTVDGSTGNFQIVWLFESADSIDMDDVADYEEFLVNNTGDIDEAETSQDGRFVTLNVSMPASEL